MPVAPDSAEKARGEATAERGAVAASERTREDGVFARARRPLRLAHFTVKRIFAVLGMGVTVAGLYHFYEPLLTGPDPKEPMTGQLNVAVAGLAAAPGTPASNARAVSDSLHRAVRDAVRTVATGVDELDIQVAGPGAVGSIDEEEAGKRLEEAGRLSDELEADILLYGTLQRGRGFIEIRPEFFFSPDRVTDPASQAPALAAVTLPPAPSGRQPLGALREEGPAAAARLAEVRLKERLADRARAFAAFVVGLAHYADARARMAGGRPWRRELAAADRLFGEADRSAAWDPRAGHVLHLFRGNVALLGHAFARAQRQYELALRFQPEYDRARFGAAEARFQRSAGQCTPASTDRPGLAGAMARYRTLTTSTGAASPLVRVKARFGLGRAALCAGSLETAREAFASVAREPARDANRAQVAGAHAGLALVVLSQHEARRDELTDAATHLDRAIALSAAGPGQAVLWSFLGNVRGRLGDDAGVRAAFDRAKRLDPGNRRAYEEEERDVLRQ